MRLKHSSPTPVSSDWVCILLGTVFDQIQIPYNSILLKDVEDEVEVVEVLMMKLLRMRMRLLRTKVNIYIIRFLKNFFTLNDFILVVNQKLLMQRKVNY
jgi:hypothetical protein